MNATKTPIVEKLLTYRETAIRLGVTERTIFSMVDRGELPAVRFGRSVRVDPADLRRFIDKAKRRPVDKSEMGDSDVE